jgi:hypothetical protein
MVGNPQLSDGSAGMRRRAPGRVRVAAAPIARARYRFPSSPSARTTASCSAGRTWRIWMFSAEG